MGRTRLTGQQVGDHSIQRDDLDTTTAGQAVVTKIVAGAGVTLVSTGADIGTGDVTISASSDADHDYRQKIDTLIWMGL